MFRRPPPPCPACPEGAKVCRCWLAEAENDKLADAYFREQTGTRLERADHKMGLSGDAFPSFEKRQALAQRMLDARLLRDYRELVRIRRQEIARTLPALRAEAERLKLHEKILDLTFDEGALKGGKEPAVEIANRFGYNSHSWTSERMKEIREAAAGASPEPAVISYVGLPCKRPRCGKPIERVSTGTTPCQYCSTQCSNAHRQAIARARRRMAGVPGWEPVTQTVTGPT